VVHVNIVWYVDDQIVMLHLLNGAVPAWPISLDQLFMHIFSIPVYNTCEMIYEFYLWLLVSAFILSDNGVKNIFGGKILSYIPRLYEETK